MADKGSQNLQKWIKENQQHNPQNNLQNNQPEQPSTVNRSNAQASHKTQDQSVTIDHLKHELKNAKNAAANAERSRDQVVNARQASKEDKGIHSMIHGFSERFDKTYHVPIVESNGKQTTYPLHIVLKPLTAADQYEVYAEEENLTNNMGRFFEANEHVVLQAFTTMRVAGIKVPDGFKDPKKLYRMQLLMQVYFDYLDWERGFCSHIKE